MAQPDSTQFLNVVTLAIVILPFFATNALDRLDEWPDEDVEGYLKFATIVALSWSVFLTIWVVSLVFNIGGQAASGVDLTAAYFLYVALYVPTLGLLAHVWMKGSEQWLGEELNNGVLFVILVGVSLLFGALVRFNPL